MGYFQKLVSLSEQRLLMVQKNAAALGCKNKKR
jgi:hypothetical protein